jgi:hypothetical protein
MSISERSPSPTPLDEYNPSEEPTQDTNHARLIARLGELPAADDLSVAELDVSNESDSPIYEQLLAEATDTHETAPTVSSVETSSSRLATLLRKGAEVADSSAESWEATKVKAKGKLRGFGRAALRAKTATVELGVGASLLAANKGVELAQKADESLTRTIENVTTSTKDTYNNTLDKGAGLAMKAGAKLENGMDVVGEKMVGMKTNVKERLATRKQAALNRRQARRQKWSSRYNSIKDTIDSTIDRSAELAMKAGAKLENGMDVVGSKAADTKAAASEKLERSKASVHTTRAAGRAALEAYRATQRVIGEQNKL